MLTKMPAMPPVPPNKKYHDEWVRQDATVYLRLIALAEGKLRS